MEINAINKLRAVKNLQTLKNNSGADPLPTQKNKLLLNQLDGLAAVNRPLAFKGSGDKFSYENFRKAAQEAGLNSVIDYYAQMTPENFIGGGANSDVYKFSDPRLENWVMKVYKKGGIWENYNPLGDLNMGQDIASCNFDILKKVSGTPHSVENWSEHVKGETFQVTRKEALKFLSDLEKIADFPQSSFDDYAKKLKILSDNNYKMDSINPNNLLIDYANKEINIIDFGSQGAHHKNSAYDLIMPLLDFSLYRSYIHTVDPKNGNHLIQLAKEIINKCTLAAEKNGISTDKTNYLSYIEYLDRRFNTHSHQDRYYYMETCFQELENLSSKHKPAHIDVSDAHGC